MEKVADADTKMRNRGIQRAEVERILHIQKSLPHRIGQKNCPLFCTDSLRFKLPALTTIFSFSC